MSEAQRRLIEATIGNLDLSQNGRKTSSMDKNTVSGSSALDRLASLGFDDKDICQASDAVASGSNATLTELLDWLCLNLPENRLPDSFAPGDKTGAKDKPFHDFDNPCQGTRVGGAGGGKGGGGCCLVQLSTDNSDLSMHSCKSRHRITYV